MIRVDLAKRIAHQVPLLFEKDVEEAVKVMIDSLSDALVAGDRIEIRGFGTFSLRNYESRSATNPKTGEKLVLNSRSIPHFRFSKRMLAQLNKGDE